MKRRVLSLGIALALCLNLCPVWVLAADGETENGLCPHHPAHTDACGYVLPVLEQECTHNHDDGCYTTQTNCVHTHTAECFPEQGDGSEAAEPILCTHTCTEDSGCVTRTLACPHEHDSACGYVPGNPGAPCTFVCQICRIQELMDSLPVSVSEDNSEQIQAQIGEIYDLYDGLSGAEQQQVDLSPCASLLEQIDGMGAAVQSGESSDDPVSNREWILTGNESVDSPYEVTKPYIIDTKEFTLTGTDSTVIQVTKTGDLDLRGTVISEKGAGVEVMSSGTLRVTGESTHIKGTTYALNIAADATVQLSAGRYEGNMYALNVAAGAEVQLSAGTYVGKSAAIQKADGDFAALLAEGCAYFNESGNQILPADAANVQKLIVKECTGHSGKIYTPNSGAPTHSWTCPYCETTGEDNCTFTFDNSGTGTCGLCGNSITIEVDRDSLKELAYDETVQPANGTVTVKVGDTAATLASGTDYTVSYSTRAEVGSTDITVTVTVTGKTYAGTFTKDYTFTKDELTQPVLQWDNTNDVSVPYTGSPVTKEKLPTVTINISTSSGVDLHGQLEYSYREQGSAAYTDGLPTNAGTYDVVVSLPEGADYQAASSEPITLVIEKISPIATAPVAAKPVFNRTAQELVTPGVLCDAAVLDGLTIEFATEETGTYSTTIPTGTDAGDSYRVWYKVVGLTGNYIAPDPNPAEVTGVEIQRKTITPDVTLSEYTYLYDGGYKQPAVTVKDEDHVTVLLNTEYEVEYVNNRNVSTDANPAKVVVTDKPGGNYAITQTEVEFQITSRTQDTLSITNKPSTFTYGDQFTLGTSGGSGNGGVTWEITSGQAQVGQSSGQVTITGHGDITVKATKSGKDPATGVVNYEDATATWTFTAVQKPVTATVTAEDKTYNGNNGATVHAVVEQGVLPGDEVTITGLTGTFDNENAGVDKTVTVVTTGAAITGDNSEHYAVSYSSLTVKADIHKAVVNVTTPPVAVSLTYNGTAQALIATGAVVDTTGVDVEYALSKDGSYSTGFPTGINAGTYTVWYRVKETSNYTGLDPASVDVTIAKKPVSPTITLDQDTFTYDGNPKEPVVTLTEPDGTIPADEYTVEYSNNVNVGTTATVTVTAKADGNYAFTPDPVTESFTITEKQAEVLTAPEAAGRPLTYNTFPQRLVTAGAGSGGTIVYRVGDTGDFEAGIPERTNAGSYTVYYKVQGDSNHSDSAVGHVDVTIAPKRVDNPTIQLFNADDTPLVNYTYDGNAKEPKAVVKDGSTVIAESEYEIRYDNNIDAGNTAVVNIIGKSGGNYDVTGSKTFVIQKADIVFNPAPTAASITYDGKPHELLVPGTTSGGTVQYALGSPTSAYSDAIPPGTDAGTYTVYYKVVGDKNHNDLNDLTTQKVSVTIQRKPLTNITIELTPDSFEYDGNVKLPAVAVKFKEGKTETVVPETEYDWACRETDPTNVGTYHIDITDAANGNYDLSVAATKTATFTIEKIDQAELAIEGKPEHVYYGDSFQLTTSGGSGNGAVTWSVTGPATVDRDGNVTINSVGEVTIEAVKDVDTNYEQTSAQWTFTAAPKPVTASIVVNGKPYDGNTTAEVASAGITTINGDMVTIDPASITAAFDTPNAGTGKTVMLDASGVQVTGDTAKYAISYPDTVTADITKATTTLDTAPAANAPLTYNGQPQALVTAGQTNVGFLVYSLDGTDFFPEIPTGTNAGIYDVYYKVDGTSDYSGISVNGTPVSVTIAPKSITPTVELSESSFLYDGTRKEPKITVKDGSTVIDPDQYTFTWANDDPSATGELLTAAGKYTATITSVANRNYSFTAAAHAEIKEATQGALKITGKPEHVYYGDVITTLEATGGSGNGTVTWSITAGNASADIDPGTGGLTVKGTGSVTVKAERTVPNYAPATDTWTFTVEPKPVEAKVTITAKDYDGTTSIADADITATVSDLVDPADSFIISGLTGVYADANAGTGKTVTLDAANATTTADTAKYAVSYPAAAKGDINPRAVAVTVMLSDHDLQTDTSVMPPSYSYTYDGTAKTPTVTVTGTDGSYSATLAASDYSVSITDNKNVGDATVTVTAKAGGNYTFADEEVKFAIRSAGAVLTSSPQAKDLTYDGTAQELVTVGAATGGTVVYSKTGADGSYSETIPQGTDAGTYTVYYKVKGDANHTDTTPGQVSVTIKPKAITPAITLDTTSYVYDGAAKTPTVTVKDGSTEIPGPNDAKPEYTVSYRDNINVGTATVTVADANGGNYIVNGTATFEITKAAPTVTDPTGKTGLQYNGASQELVNAGVSSDGTVVYSLTGGNYSSAIPVGTAVGTYTVNWKVQGDANHSDTAPATLTVKIDKNTVTKPTISLSSDRFQFNGSQQRPTITVYDDHSRIIPEHEYEVTITGTKGDNMVDVDTYTVKITTPAASNYVIADDGTVNNTRTFEIVAADQEAISITGAKAQVYYGDTIQLGATGGTGGGTVTWKLEGATDTTLTQAGLLTVKDVNTPIKVTVTRSKGGNYSDVSATWEFTAGKKPVTAVLTGDDKPFDGNANATVKAKVDASDLVFGDTFSIPDLTGTFDNANVGTNKTITITGSAPTINDPKAANYEITFPATVTASILGVAASVDTEPAAVASLKYDASQSQALVTAGTATGGTMVYSLDGANFTPNIPKGKDAVTYKVYYMAQGDQNHTDSAVDTVDVTIAQQSVTPQIELSPPSAQYDGSVKRPEAVTVRDTANNVIPASEYTIVYDSATNWKDVGKHKVKVKNVTGGNYIITEAEAEFEISITPQAPLEIVNKPGLVYYGDTFTLSATGGSSSSAVEWSSSDTSIADIDANGFVTIKGVGPATITATKAGGGNYDTATATYPFNAQKKPVTAIVTAEDRVYVSGDTSATIHVTWEQGALVGTDSIDTTPLSGTFANDQVGTDKTVTITGTPVSDATAQKYDITIPPTTTASIFKAEATAPALTASNREYDGTTQDLVTGGDANTLYSASRDGVYTAAVPTGTNAGSYTVWYKEKGGTNHNASEPQAIEVTITRKPLTADAANVTLSGNDLQGNATDGYYYEYDGAEKKPTVIIKDGAAVVPASEYKVTYSDNKNVSTADKKATVTITDSGDGNYNVSGSVTFEIRAGGAQLTKSPEARNLTYSGQPQELVTVGTAAGGHIEYKDPVTGKFSTDIPTAIDADTYTVDYKVVGDDNHTDGTTGSVTVIIQPKTVVSPKVTVSGSYTYDGNPQIPADNAIEVKDGTTTIPASEYEVDFRDNINAGTATVIITNANGGNYIVNGTGTFVIARGAASVASAPKGLENLPYNGTEQALAEAGSTSDGTMVYSLSETGTYTPAIPTGKAVKTYTVWYKVQGDSNHTDSEPQSVTASIIVNNVAAPTIQVTPESVTFNGEKQVPTVTVKDGSGLLIDGSEYTVTYQDKDGNPVIEPTNVGKYTLTITRVTNGNYTFDATAGKNTAPFEILPADQTPLTITGTRERVYYGDTIQLGITGGTNGGTVAWTVSDGNIADITNGLLTIKGVGSVTVTATSTKTGYADQSATWQFYAEKKPVTAVVTAAAKDYDGKTDATVTASLKSSDLVSGDTIAITLAGRFEDANAGTDKKVIVDSTNPQFSADSKGQGNYLITYPDTATASIFKAAITDVTAPTEQTGLTYTGLPQTLTETAGSATGGTMEYSLDNTNYSASLPTGTDAGDYEVWYRVKGDGNHKDTEGTKLNTVTIDSQEVTDPIIELTPNSVSYDGKEHKPEVTVKDNNSRVIPADEYTFEYGTGDWTKAGTYKVKVTGKTDGNYNITEKEQEFIILVAGQSPLSITNKPGKVQYGDTFTLSAVGGSITGTVAWSSSAPEVASIGDNGLVTVHKSGSVTITAKKLADGNYGEVSDTWSFSAEKKPVTAIVTANDKVYDTTDTATLAIAWKAGDLLNGDSITLNLTGKFNNANVGDNKTVTISGDVPASDKYDISYNQTTTASITPAAASVTAPTPLTVEYTGQPQPLVSAGTATNGTITYSLDGIVYGPNIPQGTNAGSYTVWYKVTGNENYKDIAPDVVPVTINPKTVSSPTIELSPSTFDYDGTPKKPDVVVKDGNVVIPASEYTVSYSNNTAIGTATVTVSDNTGGNYIVNGSESFTIKAGEAVLKDAPKANNLTYNGFAQELVTAGTAVNGQVVYSETQTGTYTTSIPMKTDAGSYPVWYKVQGANGAADTAPKQLIVTIQPKEVTPIIRLENRSSYSVAYTGSVQEPDVTVYVESKLYNDLYYIVDYANNIDVGTAEVIVQSVGGNYQFLAFKNFTITKGKAEFLNAPTEKKNLVYTGEALALVNPGYAKTGGNVLYSLDNSAYSTAIPTGINRDSYTVFAKVQGDSNYEESEVVVIPVEIGVNTVQNPLVTLPSGSFPYTGSEHKPTVTVTDDGGNVISADEYTVTYSNNVNVGTAKVNIKSKTNGNYSFTANAEFQIVAAGQTPLTITGKQDTVYYGDTLRLGTTGGSGDGAVTWSSSDEDVVTINGSGVVTIKKSGGVTITASKAASGSYGETTDTWNFYVNPKPVNAVVTAASKPFDNSTAATLTVTVSNGLVPGEVITPGSVTATGHFVDANVGENKTVIIDSLTIPNDISGKYDIKRPDTVMASITPAAAEVTDTPKPATTLTYNGSAQALLTSGGTAVGGNLAYSVDGGVSYSYNLPTATDIGSYTVWYKAVANDGNHMDSAPVKMNPVVISANTDAPTVLCVPDQFRYDGTEKTPDVVVRDSAQRVIPDSEYTVAFTPNRIAVDTYTVTVTDKSGGNYAFATPATGTFKIVSASQNPLSIITDKPTDVSYGETFRLSAMGGSGSGAIQWSIAESSIATIDGNGVVTVTGTGGFTVEAYRAASDGYDQSNTASVPFVAKPKPVTPVVKAQDKPYDGTTTATLTAAFKSGDLVGTDNVILTASGAFETADAGSGKQVTVTGSAAGTDAAKYAITWPDSTTASIYRVDAKLATRPVGLSLTYNGSAQDLITGGTTVNNIGVVEYSLSEKGEYSTTIPTGTKAGTYTVWYKVADSVNYAGVAAASIQVEIKKAAPAINGHPTATGVAGQTLSQIQLQGGATDVPGAFAWKDGSITPVVGTSQQTVVFTPEDEANYNTSEFSINVTIQAATPPAGDSTDDSGSTTFSIRNDTPTRTTVQNGTATTVVSASDGSRLVQEAVANQSESIVIKPEITGDVSKAEVSIPVSTVSQISSETDAALTVSAPIGDVTIPNAALDTLSSAGGSVSVVTEQVDQAVVLTLTAGGETVESVPGGVTLTVPAEGAGPGTVAVLVHEDGTRETIRKSVAEDGKVKIPLSGSAKVEIVDNSKAYTDVPSESWEADAVAFASAHELFSGTSETTFSPEQAMSRGMLATVLYSLEGRPDQEQTGEFSDVGSDTWYADAVAWAAESGITSGYGDGQFGPEDSITREQLAVMLWKYAGSPEASSEVLDFTDADQVSGYALEALCWATEKGILNGYTNGQLDPEGTATRAQAALMLKNFMENT